jgi:hypothetical protein
MRVVPVGCLILDVIFGLFFPNTRVIAAVNVVFP